MDTRRNFRCIVLFFFLVLSLARNPVCKGFGNPKELDLITTNVNSNITKKFINLLLNNCKGNKFFRNLEIHKSYPKFGNISEWKHACIRISQHSNRNASILSKYFDLNLISLEAGKLTAYYQPNISVSYKKNEFFKYPILKKRDGLLIERKKILQEYKLNDVLLWTNDDVELFFLQIQGSGVGVFEDGTKINISYGGNNGFEYKSIGQTMVKDGLIKTSQINAIEIKKWLKNNSHQKVKILNSNKRFIFFKLSTNKNAFPTGSFGEILVPYLSIAIDKRIYPYGLPFFLETKRKDLSLFTLSADTGAAIKGPNRADIFLGSGDKIGEKAGKVNEKLIMYFLKPRRVSESNE